MKNVKTIIVWPVLVSVITSVLIMIMVFKIIKFGDEISEYYTPVILLSKNFLEATNHIHKSLDEIDSTAYSFQIPLEHFRTAYLEFNTFLKNPRTREHTHSHEFDYVLLSEQLITFLENRKYSQAIELIGNLTERSKKHQEKHEDELLEARTKINATTYTVSGFCFLILLSGVLLSFREYRFQKVLRHDSTITAAMISLINALEAKDEYTEGHSKRVVNYSTAVAHEMGLSKYDIKILNLSALLHDIGKIGVPDSVLLKEGALSDEEFAYIKKHPAAGAKMLDYEDSMKKYLPGIIYHHERFDGRGYPEGLKGDEIPMIAQCIAIADAYDAMTSSRPYRKALSSKIAFEEIEKNRDKQWSDKIVTAFFNAVEKKSIIPV